MNVSVTGCLYMLALQWSGDLSRVYPAIRQSTSQQAEDDEQYKYLRRFYINWISKTSDSHKPIDVSLI